MKNETANLTASAGRQSAAAGIGPVLVAAVLGVSLASGAAQAQEKVNYYLGGHAGVSMASGWPAKVDFGAGVRVDGRLSLDNDTHYGLILGRETEKARFELEYQAGNLDLTQVQAGAMSQSTNGRLKYDLLTFNAYRTHAFDPQWKGYAGLGIGWGKVRFPEAGFPGVCNCFPATSDGGLAYQGRLGLEYGFGEGHKLFTQYSWMSLPGATSGGTPGVEYPRRGVGALTIGYRKNF